MLGLYNVGDVSYHSIHKKAVKVILKVNYAQLHVCLECREKPCLVKQFIFFTVSAGYCM